MRVQAPELMTSDAAALGDLTRFLRARGCLAAGEAIPVAPISSLNPHARPAAAYTLNGRVAAIGVQGCDITSLPESLGDLTHLEILHLDENQLESLPTSIERLKNLRTLHLYSNRLSE